MLWLLLGCAPDPEPEPMDTAATAADTSPADTQSPEPPLSVLVILVDDIGVETSACYEGLFETERPPQPTLSGLCAEGLTFTDAWSYPSCSPTRAALMTGKYGWRTGIGRAVNALTGGLSEDEVSIADRLSGTDTAWIGKWHLADSEDDLTHPNDMGWPHFAGTLKGSVDSYTAFDKTTNGVREEVYGYATSVVVDDALAWLSARDEAEPWVLFVSFQAAHTPLHVPPEDLVEAQGETEPTALFHSMIAALDVEIGRLLEGVDRDRTVIIYASDNGSLGQTSQGVYPTGRAKSTLYQGGVHVPLVVAGPGVASGEVSAMVHLVDLFATVLSLAGVPPDDLHDSISLTPYLSDPQSAPLREVMLTEYFGLQLSETVAGRAARTQDHKLIRLLTGHEELYHLAVDPLESDNLIPKPLDDAAREAWTGLSAYLDQIEASARHR